MDTPLTEQIRPGQPEATKATDEDCLELMEMILGALGRDALGLGSSIAHPKESEEWKGMTVSDKNIENFCFNDTTSQTFVSAINVTQIFNGEHACFNE